MGRSCASTNGRYKLHSCLQSFSQSLNAQSRIYISFRLFQGSSVHSSLHCQDMEFYMYMDVITGFIDELSPMVFTSGSG
ncbi:hypothetical protein M758_9G186300 [Ceratodon purpureus]|uniref:Uncharacterized protein n=1 Tax=Ceratodon purpureus TaxID=3225 RepID=A0A8T0GTH2_CERPU|nr:hypothetical protein KC19_9G188700 [Ceratodon purpureus]KAG0607019.1 hypothetical protein M758_9G186300 [Ceratodon purpureus]